MEHPYKRLHPYHILFDFWRIGKENIFFAFFLFVYKYNSDSKFFYVLKIIFIVYIIARIGYTFLNWFSYKYEIRNRAIHVKKGLIWSSERTVHFSKVQNIQRRTTVFHKLFRVTSMILETAATGSESSFTLHVLTQQEADALEQSVNETKAADFMQGKETHEDLLNDLETSEQAAVPSVPLPPERTRHFAPTRKDLFRASFTSLSFLILVPIFFKLVDMFGVEKYTEGLYEEISKSWLFIAIGVIALVVISVGLGIAKTFVKYGKYEITSDDHSIYIRKGVIDESAFSIQKRKVQAIVVTQSFMKRLLGLAEVKLISAGGLGEQELETSSLYPFLPVKRAYEMIEEILPSYQLTSNMERLPKNALWMRLIRHSWFFACSICAVLYFIPKYWYIPIGLTLISYIAKVLNYVNTRYQFHDEFIQMKSGAFTSTLFLTKRSKIIEIKSTRTKLQQLLQLTSVQTVNRSKPIHVEELDDLPAAVADEFYHWYADRRLEVVVENPK